MTDLTKLVKSRPLPSPEVLRQLLRYDEGTGHLFWRPRTPELFTSNRTRTAEAMSAWWNTRFANNRACKSDCHQGYLRVSVFAKEYRAHRVIWAMVHDAWPYNLIDHANGDKADNRIINLRNATLLQNSMNRGPSNGRMYCGVSYRKARGLWVSEIKVSGKAYFLGYFPTDEAAARAYDAEAIKRRGEFARLNFPETAQRKGAAK